ncbi:hypothetical protein [Melghirimyces algeriensis]|nr:hypothetical protein [Melghirimyces algeriensis]
MTENGIFALYAFDKGTEERYSDLNNRAVGGSDRCFLMKGGSWGWKRK